MSTDHNEIIQKQAEKPALKDKNEEKKQEKPDWSDYLLDFIKNPITTGVTGLAAGYMLGIYQGNKEKEELIEQHKKQIQEQGQLFAAAIQQMQSMNKQLADKLGLSGGKGDKNVLRLEEDKDNVYQYKSKRRYFKL